MEHLQQILTVPGVLAVSFHGEHHGDARAEVLLQVGELLRVAGAPTLRVVLGDVTIHAWRWGEDTVVVAYETGHRVAKNLVRLVRRLTKRPIAKRAPRSSVHAERT